MATSRAGASFQYPADVGRKRLTGRQKEDQSSGSRQEFAAMADLPTGTVTFLFTDIEGSTRSGDENDLDYSSEAGKRPQYLASARWSGATRSRLLA
jgi:hypothetical protein